NHCRTSPTISPGASGMDSFSYGALGGVHRPAYGAFVRTNPRRQATPGDGLSRLPGYHPAGWAVLTGSHGSRCRAGAAHRSVPLPEREVDFEECAGPTTARDADSAARPTLAARQHPRRGVLRIGATDMLEQPMIEKLLS